jgi:hypothetical protein|tara:strand:+ start:130 stop:459 length:330 start_codon:yes stop_codon:yes gene_type:complete
MTYIFHFGGQTMTMTLWKRSRDSHAESHCGNWQITPLVFDNSGTCRGYHLSYNGQDAEINTLVVAKFGGAEFITQADAKAYVEEVDKARLKNGTVSDFHDNILKRWRAR